MLIKCFLNTLCASIVARSHFYNLQIIRRKKCNTLKSWVCNFLYCRNVQRTKYRLIIKRASNFQNGGKRRSFRRTNGVAASVLIRSDAIAILYCSQLWYISRRIHLVFQLKYWFYILKNIIFFVVKLSIKQFWCKFIHMQELHRQIYRKV